MKSIDVLYRFVRSGVLLLLLLLLGFASVPLQANAAIASTIGYQGRLKSSAGTALTGTFTFTFRLYSTSSGGTALWTEVQPSITTSEGFFAVRLGSVTAFPATFDFNQPLYLSTEVNSDGEMSPRAVVNSVPFAFAAGGIGAEVTQPASATGGRMYYNSASGTLNYYDAASSLWRTLGSATTATLQSVTDQGSVTTRAIQFAGGTSTAGFTFQSGVTSTNLFVSNTVSTSQLYVGGFLTCLSNGTNCPAAASADTLAAVSARGSFATSTLQLYGGFVGSSSTVTSTFTVLGNTSLQGLTGTNATFTNATSGWLGATTVSTTQLFVLGQLVCLANGTNCVISAPAATSTLAEVSARGSFATTTLQLYGGFVGSSSTVTSTFTVLGSTSLQTLTGTNATLTNVTTTALSATSLIATSGTVTTLNSTNLSATNAVFTNATSGWLGYTTASGTSLFATNATFATATIQGLAVCLSNGTYCPSTSVDTLATVSARGSFATTTLQLYGGFVGSSSTVTSTFTVLGSTSLQNVTGANATFTNATATTLFGTDISFTRGTSTNWLGFATASGTSLFATNATFATATIQGLAVCLVNGSFCPSTSAIEVDTLATVSARGSFATSTLTLYGGFVGASSTVTSTFVVLGSTSLQTLTGTNATLTNVTTTALNSTSLTATSGTVTTLNSTNLTATNAVFTNATSGWLGFTTASGTSLFATNATFATATIQGLAVCLVNGSFCPSTSAIEVDTLATVSARGSFATTTLQLYGGFVGSSSTVTSTFTVLGSTSLQNVTGANATLTNVTTTVLNSTGLTATNAVFTNATSGWLGYTTASGTSLFATNATFATATIQGLAVCLVNGSFCPSTSAIEVDTLATVSARGSFATSTLQLYGGFVGSSSTVTSTFTVLGSTSLQNVTGANATFTNATATSLFATDLSFTRGTSTNWLGFATASGTSLFATNATFATATIQGLAVCLVNGSFCPSTSAIEVDTLATVSARGSFATTTLQLYGGFVGSSSTVTSTFTVLGSTSLQNVTASNATFTAVTTTNLFFTNASGTTLNASAIFVNGSATCLANGTNCPSAAEADTLATVSARGSFATSTLQLYGGFVGSSSTVTSTFTVLGSTSLQNVTASNATFTAVTTTNLFFTNASGTTLNASAIFVNGSATCLANGTNCPSSAEADTLATVSARGSFATTTLQLYGGFVGSSSTVTSTFVVLGSTSLQALTGTNATLTNVTTTALFATSFQATSQTITNASFTNATASWLGFALASGTTLNASSISVNGSPVCLLNGTNCPVSVSGVETLATVTARGAFSTNTLLLYNGLIAASSTVTSTFTVLGSTSLQDVTGVNATFTAATATNFFFTNASGSTLNASAVRVNGQDVCLEDRTNCPEGIPNVKSASSTSIITLTTAEQEIITVTSTPSVSTSQMWISYSVVLTSDSNTDRNIGFTLHRDAQGCTGSIVGYGVTTTLDTPSGSSDTVSFSFVDSPATSTAFAYHLCARTNTGSPTVDRSSIIVEEVKFGADLGEVYYSQDSTLVPGEVVRLDPTKNDGVMRSTTTFDTFAIGVISSNPGKLLSQQPNSGGRPVIVALVGRSPVLVSDENGDVVQGDPLTSASIDGYAMKATGPGPIIGRAMENASTTLSLDKIMMFVQPTYYIPSQGGQLFTETLTAHQYLQVGVDGIPAVGPSAIAQFQGTTNTYLQVNISNLSNGANASGDFVVTADNGDDSSYYIDMGINSSGYNNPDYSIGGANDGYLYVNGGDLALGTATPNDIVFHTSGTLAANERMRLTAAGWLGVGTSTPAAMFAVAGNGYFSGTLTVGGQGVCLTNGTNCPASTSTLATVTANGAFTTATLSLYGGFLSGSSTVTSTFTVLGQTNLQSVSATALSLTGTASVNDLFVAGQRVCLSDGTNCSVGESSSASSSASTSVGAETEVLVVTSTPRTTSQAVWISATARVNNASVIASSAFTFRIRRGTTCAGGTQIGVDRTVEVGTSDADTLSVSFVDMPQTTSATPYRLCALASGGTPTVENRSMVAQLVNQGADLAEVYYSDETDLSPGEVVALDPTADGKVVRTTVAYDPRAIGVVSTQPGLLLSAAAKAGGSPVMIALSGRIPVKVTAENGPIVAGDYLAASAVPGVAMKATRSGIVIGQALASFEGEGVGEVMTFVKNMHGFGSVAADFDAQGEMFDDGVSVSGTGLVANTAYIGILTADEIHSPALDVIVSGTQMLTDSFASLLGLLGEVTSTLSGLEMRVTTLEGIVGPMQMTSSSATGTGLTYDDAGNVLFEQLVFFRSGIRLDRITPMGDLLTIAGDVSILGRTTFDTDTGGFALVHAGQRSVHITFERPYQEKPVISANVAMDDLTFTTSTADAFFNGDFRTMIVNAGTTGFDILFNKPVVQDVKLSWTAFAIKNARTFSTALTIDLPPTSTAPTTDPLPELAPPTEEPAPAPAPTDTPVTDTPPTDPAPTDTPVTDTPPTDPAPTDTPVTDTPPTDPAPAEEPAPAPAAPSEPAPSEPAPSEPAPAPAPAEATPPPPPSEPPPPPPAE